MGARTFRAGLLASLFATAALAQAPRQLGTLAVPFIENAGQTDSKVAFYVSTAAGTTFVTKDGAIVYSLPGGGGRQPAWTLSESFQGGKPRPHRGERAITRVSDFHGNDPRCWRSGLPTYRSVELGEVWRGIGVSVRASGPAIEKVFTVAPGASADSIRMQLDGARRLRISALGRLIADTGFGNVAFSAPVAYQEKGQRRVAVVVSYRLDRAGYGFRLGTYDPNSAVIIDPLLQSTYLGGSDIDEAFAVTSVSSGEVLVAGITWSTDFPGTAGGAQTGFHGGNSEAFVGRLNSTLTTLLQATYLGGSESELAWGISVNAGGDEVLVAGDTRSSDFPATIGGAQPTFAGDADVFVARLDLSLETLRQATYLGGRSIETPRALAIHPASGELLIAGLTYSLDFPGTAGGAQISFGSGFTARLDSTLTSLIQATYLGTVDDVSVALAVHPISGEVVVAGWTSSATFPGVATGAQTSLAGLRDAFVARLNPELTTILGSTYLGGAGLDAVDSIAISPINGDVLVAGFTNSVDFPRTSGGAQSSYQGNLDGFAARLNPTLSSLVQATYVGGSGGESISAVLIDPSTGEVIVTGGTDSADLPATAGGIQPTRNSPQDAFVARLVPTLKGFRQATYLGGSDNDFARAAMLQPMTGDLLIAGTTSSTDFPRTSGGAQSLRRGSTDAFIARLTTDLIAGPQTPTPAVPSANVPTLSLGAGVLMTVVLATLGLLVIRKGI